MARSPGRKPGQPSAEASNPGFAWGDYVDWLVETHGTLAAVAEKLASHRAFADDVGSIERALRRLRGRGQLAGGTWGARALAAFGVPSAAGERTRWMGSYHSRFVDLPVPICQELVRLWDRPPISEAPEARVWLALAHATNTLRSADVAAAAPHLRRARASIALAPIEATIELLLVEAFVASREDPAKVPALLDQIGPLFEEAKPSADRACLFARYIDQRAWQINKGRAGAKDHAKAEKLYASIPTKDAPPFALCRRENGLAYGRWKQGDRASAIEHARNAVRHAGDGGHVRLRAMALTMLGKILGDDEGAAAKERAIAIVTDLDDEALRLRFTSR